jgi:hypothetical protein
MLNALQNLSDIDPVKSLAKIQKANIREYLFNCADHFLPNKNCHLRQNNKIKWLAMLIVFSYLEADHIVTKTEDICLVCKKIINKI